MSRYPGDDHLSIHDHKLWSLIYSTLTKFGCLTIFTQRGGSVPSRMDRHIWFMVPANHPHASKVKEYLEHESKTFIFLERQPDHSDPDWFPNTHVHVEYFTGISPYLERDESEIMTEEIVGSFLASLRYLKNDG